MFIIKDELKIITSVGYSVEKVTNETFHVKGMTDNSNAHLVTISYTHKKVECDCQFFSGFQLFCRHILQVI